MSILLIVLIIIAVLVLYVIGIYNGLVKARVATESSWSDIDTQLKKRFDLIPNLVETVKGYAAHESKVFEEVTNARSFAMQAQTPSEMAEGNNMLSSALKSLFAVSENYPALKANENFMQLQQTLDATETDISQSRQAYNASAAIYNTMLQIFPKNIVAGIFNFVSKDFFEVKSEEEREAVKVSFTDTEK